VPPAAQRHQQAGDRPHDDGQHQHLEEESHDEALHRTAGVDLELLGQVARAGQRLRLGDVDRLDPGRHGHRRGVAVEDHLAEWRRLEVGDAVARQPGTERDPCRTDVVGGVDEAHREDDQQRTEDRRAQHQCPPDRARPAHALVQGRSRLGRSLRTAGAELRRPLLRRVERVVATEVGGRAQDVDLPAVHWGKP
jgi:hypothetical protein